ncbi:MAG: aminotransferase class V-fold PLP-dependent enzyme, partial [Planctomycetota bacterium]
VAARVRMKSPDTWLHLDAVQSVGYLPLRPDAWGIDSLTLSSHKIHGPRGTGVLALYREASLVPLIAGGGQEGGRRSGTQNLPAIAGTALALEKARTSLSQAGRIAGLRDRLITRIRSEVRDMKINGDPDKGLPHILSISFAGLIGEVLLHHLEKEGIMVSTGSACHAGWKDVSETLKALKVPPRFARGTIRISLSELTTEEEIDYTADTLVYQVAYLRKIGL